MPPLPGQASLTFSPKNVDAYLFRTRSESHLEDAYAEAYKRAYEDGSSITGERVVALHCDGPSDLLIGAIDGFEAAGCEVQMMEYVGDGQFAPKRRHPKNGFMLDPDQAQIVLELLDDKMEFVGHRANLQQIRNGIAASIKEVDRLKTRTAPLAI